MEIENNSSEAMGDEKVVGLEDKGKLSNENDDSKSKKKDKLRKKQKKSLSCRFLPRFGCMGLDDGVSMSEKPDVEGSFNVEADSSEREGKAPEHLIVMVNGIIGSAQNWRYAAKQFVKAFPKDVLVHCSESNAAMLTLDGVDVMGKRLADEVVSVVDHHPSLRKISFVGHSLGGLIARYAVAVLYRQESIVKASEENGECEGKELKRLSLSKSIAGLEPVNFITSATPHLGSRGHKQVPLLCGLRAMEKLASSSSWVLRRTGKHLMLVDSRDEKPPLLLRMSYDSEDLKFISSLGSFKRRVAYANTRFDRILLRFRSSVHFLSQKKKDKSSPSNELSQIKGKLRTFRIISHLSQYQNLTQYIDLVAWSSSSLRRRNELPKRRNLSKHAKYPHIVNEETSSTENAEGIALESKVGKWRANEMEEAMIRGLTKLSWERIDVSFGGSIQRLLAHNTIQVKTYCINYHGADVIQHMVDNFQL